MWQVAWAHPMFGNMLASGSCVGPLDQRVVRQLTGCCGPRRYDRRVIIWKETPAGWENVKEYREHESSSAGGLLCFFPLAVLLPTQPYLLSICQF